MGLLRSRVQRNHQFTAENLSAYVDDALLPGQKQRVERHLAMCAACRDDLQTLRLTVALLQRAPMQRAPRSFALPLAMQPQQRSYQRWNGAFGALRTASVVVSLLLILTFSGDVLVGRLIGPYGRVTDRAPLGGLGSSDVAVEREAAQEAPLRMLAPAPAEPMPAPAELERPVMRAAEAPPQPVTLEVMATQMVEKEAPMALMLATEAVAEAAPKGAAPLPLVPRPSGVGPSGGGSAEQAAVEASPAASVELAGAPAAQPALTLDASRTEALKAFSQAPEPTPERPLALQAEPLPLAEPHAEAATESVLAERGPASRWSLWQVFRVTSGVLIGLLLMLLAGLLLIAPKRRV